MSSESMGAPGLIGSRIDRYEIIRLLGTGGFGSVYAAKHIHTDAQVALKLLKKQFSSDATMVERFLREAKAAAALGNDHIVRILDAGITPDGQAFLALEFLDGMDLQELAQREGPLEVTRIVEAGIQVLDGLFAAHNKNIVHRDMKPANVFVVRKLNEQGIERDFIKVLDFGISKMHGEPDAKGLTMTGMAMGTPSYMAPEQFFDARNVDARADVYSVAAMLYELLANRLPIEATSYADLIVKVKTQAPAPLREIAPRVPASLAQVITIGLSKEPKDRWQTARDFSAALRTAVGIQAVVPKPSAVAEKWEPRLDSTFTPPPKPQLATPATTEAKPFQKPHSNSDAAPLRPAMYGGTPPQRAQPRGPAQKSSNNTVFIVIGVIVAISCLCCGISAVASHFGNGIQSDAQSENTDHR
jgi:eukaryotic-like serine/threonine-protein kinase